MAHWSTPERFYRVLAAIADRHIGAVERAFLRAVALTPHQINALTLHHALASGDPAAVFDALNLAPQIETALRADLGRELKQVFVRSAIASETTFPVTLDLRFNLTNPEAVRWAERHAAQLVKYVSRDARAAIRELITTGIRDGITVQRTAQAIRAQIGLTPPMRKWVANRRAKILAETGDATRAEAAAERYAAKLVRYRALVIGRTETLTASQAGNHALLRQAVASGFVAHARRYFYVTPDDRLCFPAGTLISTPQGSQSIESIGIGTMVNTHLGPRAVTAIAAHEETRSLVEITQGSKRTSVTQDHPYLIERHGRLSWIEAGSLQQGDLLWQLQPQPNGTHRTDDLHLRLSDPNDAPTMLAQKRRLAGVPLLISVPIDSVNLQSDAVATQQEINAVPSHTGFLRECDAEFAQRSAHCGLQLALSAVSAIARDRTKSATSAWTNPHLLVALTASYQARRAATLFGAESALAASGAEALAAAWTHGVLGQRPSAFQTADSVSVGDDCVDTEIPPAFWADFDYLRGLAMRLVAFSGATSAVRQVGRSGRLKRLLAMTANEAVGIAPLGPSVALHAAILLAALGEYAATREAIQKHKSDVSSDSQLVYSLEVGAARTFFANGNLVHNCPICAAVPGLNRRGVGVDEPFRTPLGPVLHSPIHVQCRCTVIVKAESASMAQEAA